MAIPEQLKGMRFNRVRFKDKRAFEKGWQNKPYRYAEISKFFPKENYGVLCGAELRALDDDTQDKKLIKLFLANFDETFRVRDHLYFNFDNGHENKIIFHETTGEHMGELQGEGTYVVGAGSTHPSGEIYEPKNDLRIKTISYDKFIGVFKEFIKTNDKTATRNVVYNCDDDKFIKEIKNKWEMGNRQDLTMAVAGYLRKQRRLGLRSCEDIITNICEDCGDTEITQRLMAVRSTYEKDEKDVKGYTGLIEKNIDVKDVKVKFSQKIGDGFNKKDIAQSIIGAQPCYYDNTKNWWLWDRTEFKWLLVDETDILNAVDDNAFINTINSKEKGEIIEALKQVSRKNKPQEIKKTWIQFKNMIIDIETGEEFMASSKFFVTNPIPHELETEIFETPNMDRIFEEWVGEKNVELLYEIIAYSILPDYPIHRIFCFIGSGLNGKSCFLNLLRKFVGIGNCCSTELDTLLSSRFEVTRLHKKLVCQMGETNFNEMNKTSLLKKLSGGDLIGFEYKNKNPFEEQNYAKIIIATNNLPSTTDKTIGFYRRWMIIDFPNQFTEKKDILKDIPENEYKSLALRCCVILKNLIEKREFTNEGTVKERMTKYEAKSNFLKQFVETYTEMDGLGYITKADFYKKFVAWCKENRHREMGDNSVGIAMKKLGIDTNRKFFDWMYDGKGGQARIWSGIKWKE